jgi:hypothetical protein
MFYEQALEPFGANVVESSPLSKPAAATTGRRVFARNTTPGITQRSS